MKTISVNRKAYHDYHILETVEAGLVLTGTEIKAIREGRLNLREAYVRVDTGEMWLVNAHIAQYSAGNLNNHDPVRLRKLLLHKDQIARFIGTLTGKGSTMVPLKLYIKHHVAKVELALVKGKKMYDKRRDIAKKEADREMRRATKVALRSGS